ncbi:MAG: hypothetical protein M0R80_07910 [Proteobacteria bacterium]|nr:hypothetical protein [Pseudomonadota bacterium]
MATNAAGPYCCVGWFLGWSIAAVIAMKFYEWLTGYALCKQNVQALKIKGVQSPERILLDQGWQRYYAASIALGERHDDPTSLVPTFDVTRYKAEANWLKADRPFYNVWPKIIPMLIRLNLNKIDTSWVRPPLSELCIRLPERDNPLGFEYKQQQYFVRTILIADALIGTSLAGSSRGVCIWLDFGEVETQMVCGVPISAPIHNYYMFQCTEGVSVQEEIEKLPPDPGLSYGVQIPHTLVLDCIRLICTLCFLGNTPQLITPDVLADDFLKFENTGDWKYVEKARRRHKYGWNVGKHIEVNPHWRRPHLALYWVGKGRTIPEILPRKGALIHKELVDKVPTGRGGQPD